MALRTSDAEQRINEVKEATNQGGNTLEALIGQSHLQLQQNLNYRVPYTATSMATLEEIRKNLDDIRTLSLNIGNVTDAPSITTGASLYAQLNQRKQNVRDHDNTIRWIEIAINALNRTEKRPGNPSFDAFMANKEVEERAKLEEQNHVTDLEQRIQEAKTQQTNLHKFSSTWPLATLTTARHSEIDSIISTMNGEMNNTSVLPYTPLTTWATTPPLTPINLLSTFKSWTSPDDHWSFSFYDETTHQEQTSHGIQPVTATVLDNTNNEVQIQIRWIGIDPTTRQLSFDNISVEGADNVPHPIQVRNLSIRALYNNGPLSFYMDKQLSLTINVADNSLSSGDRHSVIDSINSPEPVLTNRLDNYLSDEQKRYDIYRETIKTIYPVQATKLDSTDKQHAFIDLLISSAPWLLADLTASWGSFYERFRSYLSKEDVEWERSPIDINDETLTDHDKFDTFVRTNAADNIKPFFEHVVHHRLTPIQQAGVGNILDNYLLENEQHSHELPDGTAQTLSAALNANTYAFRSRTVGLYTGSSHTLRDQKVTVNGNTTTYSVGVAIKSVNEVQVTVEWVGSWPVTFTWNSLTNAIQSILSDRSIDSEAVKIHAAFQSLNAFSHIVGTTKTSRYNATQLLKVDNSGDHMRIEHTDLDGTPSWSPLFDEQPLALRGNTRWLSAGIQQWLEAYRHILNDEFRRHKSTLRRKTKFHERPLNVSTTNRPIISTIMKKMGRSKLEFSTTETIDGQSYSLGAAKGRFTVTWPDGKTRSSTNIGKLIRRLPLGAQQACIKKITEESINHLRATNTVVAESTFAINGDKWMLVLTPSGEYMLVPRIPWGMINPLARNMLPNRQYGAVSTIPVGARSLTDSEKQSFLNNPRYMGRLLKWMSQRHTSLATRIWHGLRKRFAA